MKPSQPKKTVLSKNVLACESNLFQLDPVQYVPIFLQKGMYIMERYVYGRYPQTNTAKEPITWIVLESKGSEALLLSERVLAAHHYSRRGNRWEDSDLRKWLNEDFLYEAFSASQRSALVPMTLENSHQEDGEFVDDAPTRDHVALLSMQEWKKHIALAGCKPEGTPYAFENGLENINGPRLCNVWLRSPGMQMLRGMDGWAAMMIPGGDVKPWGILSDNIGVRPIIRLNLSLAENAVDEGIEEDDADVELTEEMSENLQKWMDSLLEGLNSGVDDDEDEEIISLQKRLNELFGFDICEEAEEAFPSATPPQYLCARYLDLFNKSNASFPGVKFVINANGTEFDPCDLTGILRRLEGEGPRFADEIDDFVQQDSYSLHEAAKELAEVFRVDIRAFNSQHDRLSEILHGNLAKIQTLSMLRSFAWTLSTHARREGRSMSDYSIDELERIIDFIEKKNFLNYDDRGEMAGLCAHSDIHVAYVPEKLTDDSTLDRVLRGRSIVSLNALRNCLVQLEPAMRKLQNHLQRDRDSMTILTGTVADILYAWCALCIAAQKPFFSEDGPMMCAWSYPGNQEEYIMYRIDGKTPEQRKQEKAQKKAKWLEDYGPYISNQPLITISGKKFVFTGLGVFKDEQKDHPIVQKVVAQGGLYRSSISGVTDYLVVGDTDPGESKIRNAVDQQKAGKPIQIVRLQALEDVLNGRQPSGWAENKRSEEEQDSIDPDILNDIQDQLEQLGKGITDMKDAMDQYSDFQRQKEEKEQRRKAERAGAIVRADLDEACMYVSLTLLDELGIAEKYASSEAFYACYDEDFPAYDEATLWKLRCKVNDLRSSEEQRSAYIKRFMELDVDERFVWTAQATINISPLFNISERIEQALQLSEKWFAANEDAAVQAALQKAITDMRENLRSQFAAICDDWQRWSSAKPLMYVEYSSAPSEYDENTLSEQIGSTVVTLRVRSSRNSMIVTQVVNWYAWYWGVTVEEIWLAAYKNRFDAQGRPLNADYVYDATESGDTSARKLCKVLDALGIAYQMPPTPAQTAYRAPEPAKPAAPSTTAKKEGCYIATAVYGSYDAPEVLTLRRFRDETLRRTALGRLFIRTYYRLSPPVAQRLKNAKRINALVRSLLDKVVAKLNSKHPAK